MAVNGVEIEVGQVWETRAGGRTTIVSDGDTGRTYPFASEDVSYTKSGLQVLGEMHNQDLIRLVQPAAPSHLNNPTIPEPRKHSHYFKDVTHLTHIDVYRVLELFGVTDQAIGHAVKKLLVAGARGVKDTDKDVQEAIDTLTRRQEIQAEDAARGAA